MSDVLLKRSNGRLSSIETAQARREIIMSWFRGCYFLLRHELTQDQLVLKADDVSSAILSDGWSIQKWGRFGTLDEAKEEWIVFELGGEETDPEFPGFVC